jgi:hypothetical protein
MARVTYGDWQVGFDGLDDRERRGVRPFGYRDVDGAASIHQRVTGLDVGAVFHRSDVAYEDRPRSLRADRNVVEVVKIRNDRIDRHHRQEVANADVARWVDGVTGTQRSYHLVGRHVVSMQLAGVCVDDDGTLA